MPGDRPHLSIQVERTDATCAVRFQGELDLASKGEAERALAEARETPGVSEVVVDFGGLSFMDSSGVHLALDAEANSRRSGPSMRFRRGRPSVHQVFVLTGADGQLSFDD